MSKKFIVFLFLALICVFAVSCGDGTKKVVDPAGDNEKSEETDEDQENTEPSDAENSEEENDGTETDDSGQEGIEGDDAESQDSEEFADEESWHEEATEVEPTGDSEMKTEALIVTTNKFAEVFGKFASFHTVTGISTKVVTVEDICGNAVCDDDDVTKDTQTAIKEYVSSMKEGLKYLILGGDIEDIPSRMVHDEFSIALIADYEDDFYSDLYYADFSNWDLNGNGIYAENEDVPGLVANVAVGRISVSTVEEAELYFTKLVKHHTAFNTAHTKKSLLIANIATTLDIGDGVPVNAGYYFETAGKTASLIPADYSIKRLYTESTPAPSKQALSLDNDSEKAAIEEGMNLIVHSGHGAPWLLTCEQGYDPERDFDDDMAYALENETLPFFLSCACEAGQFGYDKDDSAGEKLMNAPLGGAIVYLGNTTTGLGIAGGSQFIDEMLKNMFAFPSSTIGESYLYAHLTMPQNDTFNPPIPLVNIDIPVVNKDSWRWTKKSIVMLGDPMTVFWRDEFKPFPAEIEPEVEENGEIKTVSFHFTPDLEGAALRILADGKLYDVPYVMYETVKINLDKSVKTITVGIKAEDSQYFFKEFDI